MMCDYLQTSDKSAAKEFIDSIPNDLTFEITVHSADKQHLKYKTLHAYVHIDDVLIYDLDFAKAKYLNLKRDTEFYLTPMEAFALSMYLCQGFFEPILPHWWLYAARNIARHNDPLKDLREAKEQKKKIVITYD